jgi:hypothetical protein
VRQTKVSKTTNWCVSRLNVEKLISLNMYHRGVDIFNLCGSLSIKHFSFVYNRVMLFDILGCVHYLSCLCVVVN